MKRPTASLLAALFALAVNTSASGYTWDSMAIGGGGFVSAVIPSKTEQGMIYARTDVGGAYRWDAEHRRWVPLLDWVSDAQSGLLGVDSLAIDPHDSANIYLMAGIAYLNGGRTAILHSTDAGKTFSRADVSASRMTRRWACPAASC